MPGSHAFLVQGSKSAAGCITIPEDGIRPQKVVEAGLPLPLARIQQQILAHWLQLCPHPLKIFIEHPAQIVWPAINPSAGAVPCCDTSCAPDATATCAC